MALLSAQVGVNGFAAERALKELSDSLAMPDSNDGTDLRAELADEKQKVCRPTTANATEAAPATAGCCCVR